MDYFALKVGDEVGILFALNACIGNVTKATPAFVTVLCDEGREYRFLRKNGQVTPRQTGYFANNPQLVPVEGAHAKMEEIQKRNFVSGAEKVALEVRRNFGKGVNVPEKLREIADYLEAKP